MPQFTYRGRDKTGALRSGERTANSADTLNEELSREGIFTTEIREKVSTESFTEKFNSYFQNETLHLEELAMFARQMELLTKSGVPIIPSLRQLATYTRSLKLAAALNGVSDYLEKGKSLSVAMANYPNIFSSLTINLISIGENTGHLSESFANLYHYLEFEVKNRKMIKSTFRYPLFVMISILCAIIILNIFVIPTFARFYSNIEVSLPWETRFLIGMSNIVMNYGIFIVIGTIGAGYFVYRYLQTPSGRYKYDRFLLRAPIYGSVYRRLILIRLTQTMAIVLNSGIQVSQGMTLVKNSIGNKYIEDELAEAKELIERGTSFTQSITKIELFTPLENQIIAVGEKNGELGPSMSYIANFQSSEIEFDLKRLNDSIGPILIVIIAGLVLIMALGIYLPIWNMVDLVH